MAEIDLNHIVHVVPKVPEDIPKEQKINWLAGNLKKFCVLPWINLNTNPNGNIKLCCSIAMDHFVADLKRFNLGYDDIDDIWNSHYIKNVRNLHRQNNGALDCLDCYQIEKISGHSPRKGQNNIWLERKNNDKELNDHFEKVSNEELYSHNDMLPISLELRLGNQCNLKCVTCWGMSSSLIHEERKQIIASKELNKFNLEWLHNTWESDTKLVNDNINEWYETETFYKNFKRMAPNLRRLYTTGGEPTLIKANYRMLEELLLAGNKTCKIEFTTNMTTWNPKFYENLSKFENVEIQMSIDGVGMVGEYVRYGTEWNKVRENITKVFEMASVRPNWRILCYTVLQALNYQYITEIWDVLAEDAEKFNTRLEWWPITLTYPPFLGLKAIPQDIREKSLPRLRQNAKRYRDGSKMFCVNEHTFNTLENSISKLEYDPDLGEKFKNYKKFLDIHRAKNG